MKRKLAQSDELLQVDVDGEIEPAFIDWSLAQSAGNITQGFADITFSYGAPGDIAIVGDWDGNGKTTFGLYDLAQRLGAPLSLAEIGMPRDGLDQAVEEIVGTPYWNPRPVEKEGIRRLLADAFEGRRPLAD